LRLDIGSGWFPAPGYTTVDAYGSPDITAEMWALPLEPDSIVEIRCVHALEHIPKAQVAPTLQEWFRVLKPAGTLHLEVPDLAWCVRAWLDDPGDGFSLDRIFGSQEHEGQYHRTGFTPELLSRKLVETGFRIEAEGAIWSHEQQTLTVDAVKP
jgi:predicted SAM-dependent methyltransferase